MKELYKSPMNYLGNKYKLLPELLALFPQKINTFYDLFCGGLDVSLNVKAKKIITNDKHCDLINLYLKIKEYSGDLGDELYKLDKHYFPMNEYKGKSLGTYQRTGKKEISNMLLEQKKMAYYKLREEYNDQLINDFKIILLLMLNSVSLVEFRVVNNHITFTSGQGKVNNRIKSRLNEFPKRISNFEFINQDFRFFRSQIFKENDFVYIDPPYLGTSQYKTRWTEDDEKELYDFLDYLNKKGIKFALSNFADGENHNNKYLKRFSDRYAIHMLNDKHSILTGIIKKNNQRQEILVTNY